MGSDSKGAMGSMGSLNGFIEWGHCSRIHKQPPPETWNCEMIDGGR